MSRRKQHTAPSLRYPTCRTPVHWWSQTSREWKIHEAVERIDWKETPVARTLVRQIYLATTTGEESRGEKHGHPERRDRPGSVRRVDVLRERPTGDMDEQTSPHCNTDGTGYFSGPFARDSATRRPGTGRTAPGFTLVIFNITPSVMNLAGVMPLIFD
ncbi:hypothetical protein B0T18DRAFT_393626 [Schizothecium vesticola]|uniref:Uncharacterized protein n=1 Tax=Schizothecium vesticola TaxID=314040 RepID=A0AA40K099_9PEZI|nr:hypothetical protein B0T18DRAFT_393626 [Schizothecium vesticola]